MTKPVLTEAEILELVKSVIPESMRSDSDLCMLQGFYVGHQEGVKLERQAFVKAMQESLPTAMVKFIQKEIGK